jgi:hypothetical protein
MARSLIAILAADVAGYSRLTAVDEEGIHARFKHQPPMATVCKLCNTKPAKQRRV